MQQPSFQNKVSSTKKALFTFKILSAALLVTLLYRYTLSKNLMEYVQAIHYNWLLSGVALTVPVIILRAKRWSLIVAENGVVMDNKTLFDVYVPSFMLGLITPGRVGELIRCKYLFDKGLSIRTSFLTLVFDRLFDIIPTIFISTLFGFYAIDKGVDAFTKQLLLIIASGAVILCLVLLIFSLWKRRKQTKSEIRGFAYSPILIFKCALISISSMLISAIQVYFFASSVELETTLFESFGFASLSALVSQLPIGIGGIGSRDLVLVYLLEQAGNHVETAFLFAQTFNITSVCLMLTGLIMLIWTYMEPHHLRRKRTI
ncbi:lysylphosphatidylglycerol synthase transmembrane domain-containing protein [Idiomarina sp. Sol25]|uniref:lysylphosphatidylglycerol synthase transmembrane domain-containing protein n=1 Tax=Idiomarina sp. Sol25 TaxID=3064000 RepID=UPI00294B2283|nr:lysylphosphatidylglycerol synthase transmembrane domain-containing protein [Idiomarina sp. Sol25]MDV6328532.1 lysylphosphatidylglycerol synthase transmembrane domain-containing protein [Idiomarina sp. Sol25]